MKWFNSLPENDKKKFGAFFNDPKCFPLVAEGKDLARMEKEDFIAILGHILGASLYKELQPLKAKGALIHCLPTTHTILQPRPALLRRNSVVRVPRLLCSELCAHEERSLRYV